MSRLNDWKILPDTSDWANLTKATSPYPKLVRLRHGIKFVRLVIMERSCLRHVATLRRTPETRHCLGVYSKNNCLMDTKLRLNLTLGLALRFRLNPNSISNLTQAYPNFKPNPKPKTNPNPKLNLT